MQRTTADTDELIALAGTGDQPALNQLFSRHRARLRRMVEMRLDWRVQARLDASDILQEAYAEVAQRLPEHTQKNSKVPFFLWLRLIVGERLATLHRQHLGTKMREAGLEVSIYKNPLPAANSSVLAEHLLGKQTSPSHAAMRAELVLRLQEALNAMAPIDREVISLRHFEQLTTAETALALGIEQPASTKRYVRALKRLKVILADMPGGLGGL